MIILSIIFSILLTNGRICDFKCVFKYLANYPGAQINAELVQSRARNCPAENMTDRTFISKRTIKPTRTQHKNNEEQHIGILTTSMYYIKHISKYVELKYVNKFSILSIEERHTDRHTIPTCSFRNEYKTCRIIYNNIQIVIQTWFADCMCA